MEARVGARAGSQNGNGAFVHRSSVGLTRVQNLRVCATFFFLELKKAFSDEKQNVFQQHKSSRTTGGGRRIDGTLKELWLYFEELQPISS